MDNLITCTRCGSDACYVDEVNQDIKTYFCYGCGFQTNSLMKEDEVFYKEQIETLPELYKDLIYVDGEGKNWMPSTINIHDKGMVFVNGKTTENWRWAAVKAMEIPKEEREEFSEINEDATHKIDMSTLKEFDERDFMEALSYIGLLP